MERKTKANTKNAKNIKKYTSKEKKKIANLIKKLKNKEDMISIFKIIYEENKAITENNNGMYMFFHELCDETYEKIEQELKRIFRRNRPQYTNSDSESRKNKKYRPYVQDEFPSQNNMSPKLKFNNKEKNIMRMGAYMRNINRDNQVENVCEKFNLENLTDS